MCYSITLNLCGYQTHLRHDYKEKKRRKVRGRKERKEEDRKGGKEEGRKWGKKEGKKKGRIRKEGVEYIQDQDKSSYISVKIHSLVFHGHNINWFDGNINPLFYARLQISKVFWRGYPIPRMHRNNFFFIIIKTRRLPCS